MNGFHYAKSFLTASQVSQWTNGTTLPNGSLPSFFDDEVTFLLTGHTNNTNATNYMTSVDGIGVRNRVWSPSRTNLYMISPVYGNGKWVVATQTTTNSNYFLSTTDPRSVTWTAASASTPSQASNCLSIAFGGGVFVAIANGTSTITRSTDGVNWTAYTSVLISNDPRFIVWNGTYFVVNFATSSTWNRSTDGITWGTVGALALSNPSAIAANGAQILAFGNGTNDGAYSAAGGAFSTSTSGGDYNNAMSLFAGDGKFIYAVPSTTTLKHSTDTVAWTTRTLPFSATFYRGAYSATALNGGKVFMIPASGRRIAYSTDLITWTQASYSASIQDTAYYASSKG